MREFYLCNRLSQECKKARHTCRTTHHQAGHKKHFHDLDEPGEGILYAPDVKIINFVKEKLTSAKGEKAGAMDSRGSDFPTFPYNSWPRSGQ